MRRIWKRGEGEGFEVFLEVGFASEALNKGL